MGFLRQVLVMFVVVGCAFILIMPTGESPESFLGDDPNLGWLGLNAGLQLWVMCAALATLGFQEYLLREGGAYGKLPKSYRFKMTLHIVPCVLVWVLINTAGVLAVITPFDGAFLFSYIFDGRNRMPAICGYYMFVLLIATVDLVWNLMSARASWFEEMGREHVEEVLSVNQDDVS